MPLLDPDRPTLVVTPAAAHLQIALREALADESRTHRQRERALVGGLDVGFDPV
jgi:hypothetical protein